MMNNTEYGPTFEELLPTLRAHYAYLECGRYVMKEVFLWLQGCSDIINMEEYLLQTIGWSDADYKKHFNQTIRRTFHNCGIKEVDITSLWRLFHTVREFFKGPSTEFSEVEEQLNKIKNERNEIVHYTLLKVTVRNADQLADFLKKIETLVEDILTAFDQKFGTATEEQKSGVRSFVKRTLESARNGTTEDDVMETDVMAGNALEKYVKENLSPEDTYLALSQKVIRIAGQSGNLNIYHPGSSNVTLNVWDCQNVQQNIINIGTVNMNI